MKQIRVSNLTRFRSMHKNRVPKPRKARKYVGYRRCPVSHLSIPGTRSGRPVFMYTEQECGRNDFCRIFVSEGRCCLHMLNTIEAWLSVAGDQAQEFFCRMERVLREGDRNEKALQIK